MDKSHEALLVLGLKANATPCEIKQRYRDLVKIWHPDRFSGDKRLQSLMEEKFKEINAAYDLLANWVPPPQRAVPRNDSFTGGPSHGPFQWQAGGRRESRNPPAGGKRSGLQPFHFYLLFVGIYGLSGIRADWWAYLIALGVWIAIVLASLDRA